MSTPPVTPQQLGGIARQAQLRAQLGEQGYGDLQRTKAHASNAAQIAAGTYTANRRAGYDALVARYGTDYARDVLARAHETRRLWRLTNPTPGEHALRRALAALGFTVRLTSMPFRLETWRDGTDTTWHDLTPHTALVEASIGPYSIDVLLPHARLAIEFNGGVHVLHPERDAMRRAWIERQGITVLELDEHHRMNGSITTTLHTALAQRGVLPETTTAKEHDHA